MKRLFFMACLLSCTGAVMADDATKVNASELSKVTFEGNHVILHYKNGTTMDVADMETVVIDFSGTTAIKERISMAQNAGLEGKNIYTLKGVYMGKSVARLQPGLYVIDGKKILIK